VTVRPDLDALRAAGFSAVRAAQIAATIPRLDAALHGAHAATPTLTFVVPGRIEVFGKHTDYCGGESLLCAVDRGFTVRVAPRPDHLVRVLDLGRAWDTIVALEPSAAAPPGSWGNYVATVARRLSTNFPTARTGCDIAFESDLPSAAGLSSSSALIVACAKAIIAVNAIHRTAEWSTAIGTIEEEAAYLGTVENGADFGALAGVTGVGTFGGSEDHAAILSARPAALVRLGFAPVRRLGVLSVPSDHVFVVGVSGVVADKTGSARERYNAVSARARELVALWNSAQGTDHASLAAVLTAAPGAEERLHTYIETDVCDAVRRAALHDRLTHFTREWRTHIPAAAAALAAGDLSAFGVAASASHHDGAALLGNGVAQTDTLQRLAMEQGAAAASAFGAGFGGSVWALVSRTYATAFAKRWLDAYRAAHPERATRAATFLTEAGPALQQW
jgi:galactokinase